MAIYEKPVRVLMHDMVADLSIRPGQSISRQRIIAWFGDKYPKVKVGTVTAHLIRMSTNARGRVNHTIRKGEDDLFFQVDPGHYRLYDRNTDPPPIYRDATPDENGEPGGLPSDVAADEEGASTTSTEFAYEHDLRDYLAKNPGTIEKGLRLYEEEGVRGVEFPVGGRSIDILAVDANGNFVVIELKVSRAYDRVVGQLLRYMAWIKENLADDGKSVRGIIVGREIAADLRLACSLVPDVSLFEYQLALTLTRVHAHRA